MCTIYSKSQLHQLSNKELCSLFNKISAELYHAPQHSRRQVAAHANLDAVRREITYRTQRLKPPGF